MTAFRSIISWQPVLTDHMAATFEELAIHAGVNITHLVASIENRSRHEQGWNRTSSEVIEIPQFRWFQYVNETLRREQSALHVFGSPFSEMKVMFAFFSALRSGCSVCLVSEPYMTRSLGYLRNDSGFSARLKATIRPLLYRTYGMLMKRRVLTVFAISPLAVHQFRAMGVPARRVVPFGYFVPDSGERRRPDSDRCSPGKNGLSVVFVGSLIERKGLRPLMDSVRSLQSRGARVTLDVYGPGESWRYPFDDTGIRYRGRIPFGHAQATISNYDVLVLPSLHDGWGVVVNEALLAGVPVICSATTGAGAIVSKWHCGRVLEVADAETIANVLATLEWDADGLNEMRRLADSIRESLQPRVAALYMLDCMKAVEIGAEPPPCPWYSPRE